MAKDITTADNSLTESEQIKEFKPTLAMQKWLDTAIEIQSDSVTKIARTAELDDSNWYKWLDKDGFEDWYYENYRQKRKRWLPTLDAIGLQQAKRGSYNHWRDMREAAGDVRQPSTPSVQVNNFIAEKKDGYGI